MRNKIAFIESNTTGTGQIFLEQARKENLEILFLTSTPYKYSFLKEMLIHPIIIDTDNTTDVANFLKNVSNLISVMSSSESYVYCANVVAKMLYLPYTEPESIKRCRDKQLFGKLLSDTDLPNISTWESICDQRISYPIVIKPTHGTGSIDVKLCSSAQDALKHISTLTKPYLIQKYICGDEYSAEIIVKTRKKYEILGITRKYLGPKPYFVEYGHDFPAIIEEPLYKKITHAIEEILRITLFNFGPIHIEFRIYKDQIYIIEINPRLAGGMIPLLIEQSQKINLIGNLIRLYTNKVAIFQPRLNYFTKISFIVPKQTGIIDKLYNSSKTEIRDKGCQVKFYKRAVDQVNLRGDFTDRIGHVITVHKSRTQCAILNEKILSKIVVSVIPLQKSYAHSRLKNNLDSKIVRLLNQNYFTNFDVLKHLSLINIAHAKMLEKCNIINKLELKELLTGIKSLEAEKFYSVKTINNTNIGYYLAYEKALSDKIGAVAGLIHTGRSRNDIKATIRKFQSLEIFYQLYRSLWQLRSDILLTAQINLTTSLPIYSQYQPAMPGTYGYYLLAIEVSLQNYQADLKHTIALLQQSPMGTASGAGTTYPIKPEITSKLLGFNTVSSNALNTVATRDAELKLLSIASSLGVLISRIAQDYHIWLTQEFAFFELPDSLCGISSAMPQKKNPYILEKIKGKSISVLGELTKLSSCMQKVPFSNSVEIGTEAFEGYEKTFSELVKSLELLAVIIQEAKPNNDMIEISNKKGLTIATEISEQLARQNAISYREAYNLVAAKINKSLSQGQDTLHNILLMVQDNYQDSSLWHQNLEYGNGPGTNSLKKMILQSTLSLNKDRDFFIKRSRKLRR